MRVRCAWCRHVVQEKAPLEVDESTHSICRDCMRRLLAEGAREVSAGKANEAPPAGGAPA